MPYLIYTGTDGKRVVRNVKTGLEAGHKSAMALKGFHYLKTVKAPSIRALEKYSDNGICPTPDGCRVEPDGTCEHGLPSWMLILHII